MQVEKTTPLVTVRLQGSLVKRGVRPRYSKKRLSQRKKDAPRGARLVLAEAPVRQDQACSQHGQDQHLGVWAGGPGAAGPR